MSTTVMILYVHLTDMLLETGLKILCQSLSSLTYKKLHVVVVNLIWQRFLILQISSQGRSNFRKPNVYRDLLKFLTVL